MRTGMLNTAQIINCVFQSNLLKAIIYPFENKKNGQTANTPRTLTSLLHYATRTCCSSSGLQELPAALRIDIWPIDSALSYT